MQWTQEQREAIETRHTNLLLSAAAGSGKTTVLVERVLRLIGEGADVGRMLIVTFTRAAAADMRASLIKALNKAGMTDARFRAQAEAAEYAGISTIHSFCIDLLREHFQKAEVDPAFRVADSAEAAILRGKALEAAMNEAYAAASDDLQALAEGRTPDEVRALAVQLYEFVMDRPDPWGWLDGAVAALERGEDRWSDELVRSAKRVLSDARALAEEAQMMCRQNDFIAPYLKSADADLTLVDSLLGMDYEPLRQALSAVSYERMPVIKGAANDADCQEYQALRKEIKRLVGKAAAKLPLTLADALSDLPESAREMRALREIVRLTDDEYTRLKNERSLLTFGDLERRALAALRDETVAQAMRERYDYIFVDEYQDVSDIQEAILTGFAGEDNLFCVGDVKQSIYRFRNAEPSLFQSKFERYGQGEGGRLVLLNNNFRSRSNVLRFTNAVFERAMRGGETEIVYDERAALKPGAAYEGDDPAVELYLIGRGDRDEAAPNGEDEADDREQADRLILDMKDAEAEALLVARRIRELTGTPFYDAKKGGFRPLEYRDFVILIRQAKDVAAQMLDILKREGVPAYADVSGGYLDVVEVRVAVALLRLIENRRRDAEWIAVLRSPVMGLTSEELAAVRLKHSDGSYCDAVSACAADGDDALSDRLRGLTARLDRWRGRSRSLPLATFIFDVMRESNLYACVGALPGGVQRQANLDILCDRAAAYEAAQSGGLTGFLDYLDQMTAAREDMGEAHVLGENDNVVRIMTVHKSKGLEFPVVFGSLMGRSFNTRASHAEMRLHRDCGAGLRHVDNVLGSKRDTLPRLAAAERQLVESQAEELRILYVLMTRAKERLILTGSCADVGKQIKRGAISVRTPLQPASYLDVILPAVLTMPGGRVLESGAEIDGDGPNVEPHALTRADLSAETKEESAQAVRLFDEAAASEPDETMTAAYRWRYPYEGAVMLPRKLTASGLSRTAEGPAEPPEMTERPAFMTEDADGLTGAERGTAAHEALQNVDLEALRGLRGDALHSELVRQLNDMAENGALTPAMREAVRPRMLAAFFEDGPGRRMLTAETLRREWMFTCKMTARETLGVDSDETVLIQGSIDCCFIEDGAWVLLDYKTDRTDDEDELRRRYEPQLVMYADALERITGTPVRETLICLLRSGRTISVSRAEKQMI